MAREPRGFRRYRSRARVLIESPDALMDLVARSGPKLAAAGGRRVQAVRQELELLIDLVRCWVSGEYRTVSTRTVVMVVAAVLYFVVPMDLVPDFLPAVGLVDDAAVIGYVVNALRAEIASFAAWRADRARHAIE